MLANDADVTRWAPVLKTTNAYERPSYSSPVVVAVSRSTPEGTTNLVVADGEIRVKGDSNVKIFAEARYHYIYTTPIRTTLLPVTFGFRF